MGITRYNFTRTIVLLPTGITKEYHHIKSDLVSTYILGGSYIYIYLFIWGRKKKESDNLPIKILGFCKVLSMV